VVGDSLVGGPFTLVRALREQLAPECVRVVQDTWVGVGISKFSYNRRLRDLLQLHRPTHVFVVLGTNDYLVPAPARLAPAIERVAARASSTGARCAWLGPLVQKDTGIVALLAEHAGPCTFVDARRYGLATTRDGFHPTPAGAAAWATSLLEDLRAQGWTFDPEASR
jgi:lysophospholipase L1-like esterase